MYSLHTSRALSVDITNIAYVRRHWSTGCVHYSSTGQCDNKNWKGVGDAVNCNWSTNVTHTKWSVQMEINCNDKAENNKLRGESV
jgi:hypothetical protein